MNLTHQSGSKSITTKDRRDKTTSEGVSLPSRTIVHAKLEMTSPQDAQEHEADTVANEIVCGGKIRRKISQGGSGSSGIAVSSQMESQLSRLQGGQQMLSGLQNMMENGFGRDFSQVRLHTDSDAVTISSSIQAKAFTLGNDIYFNQGQYSPESSEGQKLVAHELTHVIQENRKVGRLEEQVVIEPFNRIALDDKITDICNNVKAKITIYNAEIQKPVLNRNRMVLDLFRNSYKENVDSTSSTPNTVFIDNIKNLLEVLEKNVKKLKISTIGIDKTRQDGSVVFAETIIDNMKIDHEIICYNGFLNQNLENRAFTIIHEFSHMYMNANDDCYWSVAETAEDYCGKMSDTSKESVASAIEYFVKKVYYGDFRKPNVPNVPFGTKKEFDIGSKISPQ